MEDRRIPIEDVEEVVVDDDDFVTWYEHFMASGKNIKGYESKLVDEDKVNVEVMLDGTCD